MNFTMEGITKYTTIIYIEREGKKGKLYIFKLKILKTFLPRRCNLNLQHIIERKANIGKLYNFKTEN